jgi:hypothetical protein
VAAVEGPLLLDDEVRLDVVRLREAAVLEPPPLREPPDRARVPLDLVLDAEPLVPFRDFEPVFEARDDRADDDFRWVLGDVLRDDERCLA